MIERITIAGDIGSGKTTVAKRLAGILGVEPVSIGTIQRHLAEQLGITTLELNKLAEQDPSIDRKLDSYQKGLTHGPLLVDARLGWHFVPNTLKLYLYISNFEGARRILGANRSDEAYEKSTAAYNIFARRRSEIQRFAREYGVHIENLSNYDLVIDTTLATIDEVVRKVHKHMLAPNALPATYVCTKNMLPTKSIKETSEERIARIERDIIANGYNIIEPIKTVYVDHIFYILDGHARTGASIRNEITFVPVSVQAADDDILLPGITAREYVRDASTPSRIREWEAAFQFRYRDPLWEPWADGSNVTTAG